MRQFETISADVLDLSYRIHRDLGPGLLESAYEAVPAAKLERMGCRIARQRSIGIEFEDVQIDGAFRIDLLVEESFLVEIKSVEALQPVHAKQLLTYLRLTKQPAGLLINFGGATLKGNVRRLVNNHQPFASSRLRANQITE